MEQLDHMVTFARVVQAGSFAGGARRLGVTTSVASKHVAKLEQAIGAKLLNRSTRALSLTEAGSAYFVHCAKLADEIDEAGRAVSRLQARPGGLLRVSGPPALTLGHVIPHMGEFRRRYPDVRVEFDLSTGFVDLAEDGFDLALRVARQLSPALAARKLAHLRSVVCAAPAYLERRGTPAAPAELAGHDCLTFTLRAPIGSWALRKDGVAVDVPVRGTFSASAMEPLRQMALDGLGIATLPTFLVGADLQEGRLRRLFADHALAAEPDLYAVHLPQPYLPPKLRCFVDFLAERIGTPPYWDRGVP